MVAAAHEVYLQPDHLVSNYGVQWGDVRLACRYSFRQLEEFREEGTLNEVPGLLLPHQVRAFESPDDVLGAHSRNTPLP